MAKQVSVFLDNIQTKDLLLHVPVKVIPQQVTFLAVNFITDTKGYTKTINCFSSNFFLRIDVNMKIEASQTEINGSNVVLYFTSYF